MDDNSNMCIAITVGGGPCSRIKTKGNQVCGTHLRYVKQRGMRLAEYNWLLATRGLQAKRIRDSRFRNRAEYNVRMRTHWAEFDRRIEALMVIHRAQVLVDGIRVDDQLAIDLGNKTIKDELGFYLRTRGLPEDRADARALGIFVPPEVEPFVEPDVLPEEEEIFLDEVPGGVPGGVVWYDHNNQVVFVQAHIADAVRHEGGPAGGAVGGGELAAFVRDAQNVHTRPMVKQTTDMIEKILTVEVPEDYQWATGSLRTPGEIMMTCKISHEAGWQLMSQYAQKTSIYGLGDGIYGKTLDAVWQYILKSPEKESMCAVLKQEMQDNIGMCAQGNLTRVCNILAGFMDGVGSLESVSEQLGRRFGAIAEHPDPEERIKMGADVLRELNVPEKEWPAWLEPLE